MQKGNDHVALMCTKVVNKNVAQPSGRIVQVGEGRADGRA
jgi:hypothetical protein